MVFSSLFFLTIFLPVFLIVYYLLPFRYRSVCILIGSYLFYAWWRVDFTGLFAAVALLTYLFSLRIARAKDESNARKWLVLGVTTNLFTLGYFKYFNFGIEALHAILNTSWMGWEVILPIGISFYIFHCISYLVDIYRKDAEVAQSYWDFAAFTALFPHLIAGPVLRYKDLAWQFKRRIHSWEKFNEGVLRFAIGFAKKVIIADTLAPLAESVFSASAPTMAEAWLGIFAYAAQLYFDFSGYSDMAVGLALMLGFRFIENFNYPYISRSVTEFWKRWHISLSIWLRDYLYIPLGGNRKGSARTYINLFITMLLGGLWHGANLTFVVWGAWHGTFLVLERKLSERTGTPYPAILAWPITFLVILLGWVFFRADNIDKALIYLKALIGWYGIPLSSDIAWKITPLIVITLMFAYLILLVVPMLMEKQISFSNRRENKNGSWVTHLNRSWQMLALGVFAVAISKLVSQSYSPFLYFQF